MNDLIYQEMSRQESSLDWRITANMENGELKKACEIDNGVV